MTNHFAPVDPIVRTVDLCRWGVIVGLVAVLVAFKPAPPNKPAGPKPGQTWLQTPADGATVQAGIVKFAGTGPKGVKVEVVENGRIVASGLCDAKGEWKASGKLFGTGPTVVFVRPVAFNGRQSRNFDLKVKGRSPQTLFITKPKDNDDLGSGRFTIMGKGKPGDTVILAYARKSIAKVTVAPDGTWEYAAKLIPDEEGEIRAISKAEGEITLVFVTGPG